MAAATDGGEAAAAVEGCVGSWLDPSVKKAALDARKLEEK